MNLYDLKTNNLKENNNVGRQNPVFGWRVKSDRENIFQESYRIRIWTEDGELVWDSGCMKSSRMSNISYEGKELRSGRDICGLWTVFFPAQRGGIMTQASVLSARRKKQKEGF